MDINFNSLEELYRRIKPALITKKEEMNRGLYPYIEEEDIWNYLKEVKWKKTLDLSLSEMVNDILNCDDILIDNYLKMINEEEYDKEVLKELLAFDDTSKQPSRIKCATLSANGIKDYLEKENHS